MFPECGPFQLPLDMSTLTEDQRKQRLKLRREPVKLKVEEDLDDSFNAKKYLRYIKKWIWIEHRFRNSLEIICLNNEYLMNQRTKPMEI